MWYKVKRIMAWLNQVRLPSDFQEVEYIENGWTQYIRTNLDIKTGYRQVMKVRFLNTLAASSYPWLAWWYLWQSWSTYYRLYLCWLVSNNTFQVWFMWNHYDNKWSAVVWTDYEIDFSRLSWNLYFKIDWTTIQTSSETRSTSLDWNVCLLWTYSQDGNPQYRANPWMRLYYSKFYNSAWTLVADLVPCYLKSNGEIWMYDLVNNVFYTNAWTWTFTKGNDVPNMIEEQIYPAWWKPWDNTIAYYPFRSDILDHSWNNNNFTGSWYSFANNMITTTSELIWPIVTPENTIWDRTINIWCNRNNTAGYSFRWSNNWTDWYLNAKDGENWNRPWAWFKTSSWYRNRPSASDLPDMWNVILMTWTKTGDTMKLYIDGVLTSTTTLNTSTRSSAYWITKSSLSLWTFWEIIIEDRIRTPDEIEKYYNDTKRIYNPLIKPWVVNEHTVAYYPLEENVNDYSGNANHGSGNPNSFNWWVANYSGNSTILPYSIINRNVYTVNVWAYANSAETTWNRRFLWQHTSSSRWFNLGYIKNSWINYQTWPNSNTTTSADYADSSIQWWHLITAVSDGTTMYLYVDWELKDTDTYTWNNWQTLYMWYDHWYSWYAWNWKLSELIVEDIAWEPRKIEKYYNDTKENYLYLEESLDLITKSASEIQAKWWYLWWKQWASNYSLSSNWLTNASSSNNAYWVWYKLPDNITPKKITLNWTRSITSTSTYAWFWSLHYWANEWFDSYNYWDNLFANFHWWSLDNNKFVWIGIWNTAYEIINDTWYSWTWTFYWKLVIDIDNKTVEYSTTSPREYSKSATLSDTYITAMNWWKYLIFGWTLYSTPWSVLKNCSFSVEY